MNPPESTIARSCPVCEGADAIPWGTKPGLSLVRCGGCGLVFQTPLPREFESGEYYSESGAAYYLSADKLASDHSPSRYQRELSLFRRHVRQGAVLDVGCGTGGFLQQLLLRHPGDYDLAGTDVPGPALDHAEQLGLKVHRKMFLEGKLTPNTWDAVTFWAVLEHLAEPKDFLEAANRALRPGGICLALVPNLDSLAVRLLGMKYRYVLPQHLNYFSAATLKALFAAVPGWEIVAIHFSHFNPLVIGQDFRGGSKPISDEERARLLARTTALKQRRGLPLVRWAYALSEAGLASLHLTDNVTVVARKTAVGF